VGYEVKNQLLNLMVLAALILKTQKTFNGGLKELWFHVEQIQNDFKENNSLSIQ
jgi:hypothetical protein